MFRLFRVPVCEFSAGVVAQVSLDFVQQFSDYFFLCDGRKEINSVWFILIFRRFDGREEEPGKFLWFRSCSNCPLFSM